MQIGGEQFSFAGEMDGHDSPLADGQHSHLSRIQINDRQGIATGAGQQRAGWRVSDCREFISRRVHGRCAIFAAEYGTMKGRGRSARSLETKTIRPQPICNMPAR